MSGKRSLRFQSTAEMPNGMRALYEQQQRPDVVLFKTRAVGKTEDLAAALVSLPTAPPRSKYGAVATYVDGIRFDSKREAKYYEQLKLRVAAGEVRYFLRQVPFHLPGGTKLVVDFLEVWRDGSIHVIDAKGRETATFRVKKREVEHHYPVEIELV